MSQILKTYLSLFLLVISSLIFVCIISADVNVTSAREFHSTIVKEIEESNMSQSVIESCKENAQKLGYILNATKVVDDKNKTIAVELVLNYEYSIPIINVFSNHEIRAIAR